MNRRSFLQTMLAASVAPAIVRFDSLMRPVTRYTLMRAALPIVDLDGLIEEITHDGYVDVYTYSANFGLLIPDNAAGVNRVWADGRLIHRRPDLDGNIARFNRFPLADFGNRIPNIEFEIKTA